MNECTASVRVKRGNMFIKNLNVHIQNCMVSTEHQDLKKLFFFCACVCVRAICSEEKEKILCLHFICSCHLCLGIVKVKKGLTKVSLV